MNQQNMTNGRGLRNTIMKLFCRVVLSAIAIAVDCLLLANSNEPIIDMSRKFHMIKFVCIIECCDQLFQTMMTGTATLIELNAFIKC